MTLSELMMRLQEASHDFGPVDPNVAVRIERTLQQEHAACVLIDPDGHGGNQVVICG
jgi:hypothetical protein